MLLKTNAKMPKSDFNNTPSRYEIQCENGEFDDDEDLYQVVECDNYYMIGYYKYDKSFPQEWALSHLPGTGPEECNNCAEYGAKDDVFVGYCANCAIYDYNSERGEGMWPEDGCDNEEVDILCTKDEDAQMLRAESEENLHHKAAIISHLRECASDLDFVFDFAAGKVAEDDPRVKEFFGLEDDKL